MLATWLWTRLTSAKVLVTLITDDINDKEALFLQNALRDLGAHVSLLQVLLYIYQGSIDFNTFNIDHTIGMYFLVFIGPWESEVTGFKFKVSNTQVETNISCVLMAQVLHHLVIKIMALPSRPRW